MNSEPVVFVWPGDLHLEFEVQPNYKTALWMADHLSGRYNPYPMVEPVVRETKFC